ncbi:MAG: hypothetical protein U0M96_02690 [Eggerthellaceae bacterium]
MNATEHDIAVLRKLQEADRKIRSAKKEFETLPHRQAILEVRAKKDEVLKKKIQVQDMLDDAEGQLASFVREDEELEIKQDEVTKALAEVQGDYRAVTAQTRELDGVRKRREKVALELSRVEDQVNKINPVMKQIMKAFDTLDAKEKELVESFQETGGSLRAVITEGEKVRTELAAMVDPSLLKVYEQTLERCGGVAIVDLVDDSCGACRTAFDQSRMSKIRSEAPIAVCPACRRLLIVEE